MKLNMSKIIGSRSFITRVFKGATVLFIGVAISQLCNFAFRYILIHTWTPSDYGIFTLIITVIGLLGIFTLFNLNATAAIYLAKDIKNPANKRTLVELLFIFVLLTLFALAVTFGITRFSGGYAALDVLRDYFGLIWLLVIFTGLTAISWGVFRAYKKMNYEAISNIVKGVSTLGLALLAIYVLSKDCISSAVTILIVAQILAFLVAVALLFWIKPVSIRSIANSVFWDTLREVRFFHIGSILYFSFLMSALSISSSLLVSIDRIMIPQFLSVAMLGFYGGANLIAQIPKLVTATIAASLVPFVSEISGDMAEAKRQYLNFLTFYTFLAIISYGLFAYFVPYLVSFLLPEEYGGVVLAIRILLAGMFFAGIYSLNAAFTASVGRTKVLKKMIAVLAGAAVANIGLNWVLIPKWGIEGAAIASVVSFAIAGFISMVQVIKIRRT
jgi:O-antigen/teichoic acid export membrane protein